MSGPYRTAGAIASEASVQGWDEALKIVQRNKNPRYLRMEELERWVDGTQYSHLPSWWDDTCGKPLWERAPCVVYPVVQIAIGSYVDLLFGEGRFPAFSARPDEDDANDEDGLGKDDSEQLDGLLDKYHDQSKFKSYCREALAASMGCGSTVGIHGVRNGKPFAEALPAKWCTPEFDGDRNVTKLIIQYPYCEEYQRPDGTWSVRVKLYRREIDGSSDVTMLPALARPDGVQPSWVPNQLQTFSHGLGFCPVIWYGFMRGCAPVNDYDGKALHALVRDEIHQHDIAVSQRHRCALLSEFQICEIGVDAGHNPTGTGRAPVIPSHDTNGNQDGHGYRTGAADMGARMKGPGYVWQYPNPETKVEVLSMGKDTLEAQSSNASDLRLKIQESLCVVFLDPENIKFAATTSGKALEAIKQKQIDRCDQYRDDLAENFLMPSVQMQLRILSKLGASMKLPGAKKAPALLKKFDQPDAVAAA